MHNWVRACSTNSCLEMADDNGLIIMRTTDLPERVVLATLAEAEHFIDGVKRGVFDAVLESARASALRAGS